jgi:hypothetical protein
VTHQGVFAGAGLHVPDANGGVERATHNVDAVKLKKRRLFKD